MRAAFELLLSLNWRGADAAPDPTLDGVLVSFSGGVVQVFGTVYATPSTAMAGTGGAVTVVQAVNPGARTLTRLRIMTVAAIPAGNTLTAQMNVNGVDHAGIVVAMVEGEQTVAAEGTVELADQDLVAFKFVQTGLETIAIQAAVLEYDTAA